MLRQSELVTSTSNTGYNLLTSVFFSIHNGPGVQSNFPPTNCRSMCLFVMICRTKTIQVILSKYFSFQFRFLCLRGGLKTIDWGLLILINVVDFELIKNRGKTKKLNIEKTVLKENEMIVF